MSVDYYLYTVVGIPVNESDLIVTTTRNVESCEHPERMGQNFCPKCGVKVAHTIEEDGEIFIGGFELYKSDSNKSSGIYGVALNMIALGQRRSDNYVDVTNGCVIKPDSDLQEVLASVKANLTESNMSLKGLDVYTIVRVSY